MVTRIEVFFVVLTLFSVSLSGCIGSSEEDMIESQGETLIDVQNPCLIPTESETQSVISLFINGDERLFRLSVPNTDAGTKLPVIIAFHGGGAVSYTHLTLPTN